MLFLISIGVYEYMARGQNGVKRDSKIGIQEAEGNCRRLLGEHQENSCGVTL